MRQALAVVVAAILLGACSSSNTDTTFGRQDVEGKGRSERKERAADEKPDDKGKKKEKLPEEVATALPGGSGKPAPAKGAITPTPIDTSNLGAGPEYAVGSSVATDPSNDATKQGLTPGYGEVLRGSAEGLGEQLRMTISLSGRPPDKMPNDETYMVVSFGLQARNDAFSFGAQATTDGWTPYAGSQSKGSKGDKFPGTFAIEGSDIVFTVPWSYLDGPREFKWIATSAWFTSVADTVHYIYDTVPNSGRYGHYPQ